MRMGWPREEVRGRDEMRRRDEQTADRGVERATVLSVVVVTSQLRSQMDERRPDSLLFKGTAGVKTVLASPSRP